jgi:2-phospho-L-lactate guanylyltransferase
VVSWSAVLPVKRLDRAKTRLDVPGLSRADLALAMALDTAAALLSCAEVSRLVAVTDDPRAAAAMSDLGALVVPDVPDRGLNDALRHGAAQIRLLDPGSGIVTMASDLPAAHGEDIAVVLRAAAEVPVAFLADARGSGTTLLTAGPDAVFEPRFGTDSRERHRSAGAQELAHAVPGLRRDVDTLADLRSALRLGCGPQTTALCVTVARQ